MSTWLNEIWSVGIIPVAGFVFFLNGHIPDTIKSGFQGVHFNAVNVANRLRVEVN
jgi:hypothetical protein